MFAVDAVNVGEANGRIRSRRPRDSSKTNVVGVSLGGDLITFSKLYFRRTFSCRIGEGEIIDSLPGVQGLILLSHSVADRIRYDRSRGLLWILIVD